MILSRIVTSDNFFGLKLGIYYQKEDLNLYNCWYPHPTMPYDRILRLNCIFFFNKGVRYLRLHVDKILKRTRMLFFFLFLICCWIILSLFCVKLNNSFNSVTVLVLCIMLLSWLVEFSFILLECFHLQPVLGFFFLLVLGWLFPTPLFLSGFFTWYCLFFGVDSWR